MYSDDEEGDSTFTVRRIARGGLVYVEEDDESLSLQYVRKKVRVFGDILCILIDVKLISDIQDTIIDITDTSYDNFYDIDKNNL